jgi:hypothetical protein
MFGAMTTSVKLTQEFMGCTTCFRGTPVAGMLPLWPPRGWAGPAKVTSPSVLVVSLNPGHPLKVPHHGEGWDEEALLSRHGLLVSRTAAAAADRIVLERAARVTTAAAEEVLALCRRSYLAPTRARDHLFHRRSVAYARALLWLLGVDDEWANHCWFTDLVKCSTRQESGKPLPPKAISNCAVHLKRELVFVQPSVVAALGVAVERPIRRVLKEGACKAPVARLLHPSRWEKLTMERQRKSFQKLKGLVRDPKSSAFVEFLEALQQELTGTEGRSHQRPRRAPR